MRSLALLFWIQLIEAGAYRGRYTDDNSGLYPNCDIRLVYYESIYLSPVIPGHNNNDGFSKCSIGDGQNYRGTLNYGLDAYGKQRKCRQWRHTPWY